MSAWSGVIAVEGAPTGDGRTLALGATRWRDRISLFTVDHASSVGTIDEVWRDGTLIRARGTITDDSLLPVSVAIDAGDADMETVGAILRFTRLEIVGVTIVSDAAAPWALARIESLR